MRAAAVDRNFAVVFSDRSYKVNFPVVGQTEQMAAAPVRLSSSRDSRVFVNQRLAGVRLVSECASSGFNGSSKIRISPPRLVGVPLTEVASLPPRNVSSISVSEFL